MVCPKCGASDQSGQFCSSCGLRMPITKTFKDEGTVLLKNIIGRVLITQGDKEAITITVSGGEVVFRIGQLPYSVEVAPKENIGPFIKARNSSVIVGNISGGINQSISSSGPNAASDLLIVIELPKDGAKVYFVECLCQHAIEIGNVVIASN